MSKKVIQIYSDIELSDKQLAARAYAIGVGKIKVVKDEKRRIYSFIIEAENTVPVKTKREQMIEDILLAWNYNPTEKMNTVYIGGMAAAHVCSLLNVRYGSLGDNMEKVLREKDTGEIKAVWHYLDHYIKHAKKNPLTTCSECGRVYSK